MTEKQKNLVQIAEDILHLSRNILLMNLRFLDVALSQFELVPIEMGTLLTDGKHILYNPKHILQCYKTAEAIPARDYLHIVMHCVFKHMYVNQTLNRTYWDLACDIAVENAITELGLKAVTTAREQLQVQYINAVKKDLKHVTAEKIYSYLRQTVPNLTKVAEIRGRFFADNHEIWYMTAEEIETRFGLAAGRQDGSEEALRASRAAMAATWQTVSERMQIDLETFGKRRGSRPGAMLQSLAAVNREKYDYAAFLRKFAVMGETMKINDEEFDYIFYTYGLRLYEKVPLIEPLEYKEIKAIREFIIAIDTSGSTSGALAQKFVQKTYNILKSTESFFTKINLHIIQCDADIQEDKKITCQREFDEYLRAMQIRGHGGTDFRPVFAYVETLRKQKVFTNLKGMIYFTDGCGRFPNTKPDYETAFVFVDDAYNSYDVPPWAIKLILPKNEL